MYKAVADHPVERITTLSNTIQKKYMLSYRAVERRSTMSTTLSRENKCFE